MELPLPDVPVSPVASGMDRTIDIALNALRDRGYACVVFSPEQLNGMSADALESGLVKDGMQRIEFQQDEEV
jgi:tRNA1(Val) A37 N6-methylase TrmN6